MTVSIIIGTFGDKPTWDKIARPAVASAENQTHPAHEIIRIHADNLAYARNYGAEQADGEWLCFLDADDELDYGYIEAMLTAEGDVRRPATLGVVDGKVDDRPVLIPRRNLMEANFIVIGSLVRRDDFCHLGGFDDTLPCLEDWDFWIRCWRAGAEIVDVPAAVYRVTVRAGSRNQNQGLHNETYNLIRGRYR